MTFHLTATTAITAFLLTATTAITAFLLTAVSVLLFLDFTAIFNHVDSRPETAYISHDFLNSQIGTVLLGYNFSKRVHKAGLIVLDIDGIARLDPHVEQANIEFASLVK